MAARFHSGLHDLPLAIHAGPRVRRSAMFHVAIVWDPGNDAVLRSCERLKSRPVLTRSHVCNCCRPKPDEEGAMTKTLSILGMPRLHVLPLVAGCSSTSSSPNTGSPFPDAAYRHRRDCRSLFRATNPAFPTDVRVVVLHREARNRWR